MSLFVDFYFIYIFCIVQSTRFIFLVETVVSF
jgi:hypothetical protein